ncbi:MAG: HAD family hydrolase [Beijerinckiaceae bacterium]
MSASPRIAVFDIGNVLVRWDMRFLFEKVIPDRRELDAFLGNVCTMEWHGALDAGATFASAIAQLSARFPEYADFIALYDPRWQETISGPIAESVQVLEDLRAAGVPTYAITNFPAEKFDETCALYPYLAGFRGVIVSGRERITKPDPAIFHLLLERYRLSAADCVFIDDNPANVAAAQSVGFTALLFTMPAALRAELRALGLPV